MLAVELLRHGHDPLDGEIPHRPADELVLFREVVVRRHASDRASSAISLTP
jgi:hypothetical protein